MSKSLVPGVAQQLAVVVLAVIVQPTFGIITISSGAASPTAETDRFLNDPDFLQAITDSSAFDFTGVGQANRIPAGPQVCANQNGSINVSVCWATMISPTLFLSATHSHPIDGASVDFHDDNGQVIATRTVVNGSSIAGAIQNASPPGGASDLWIGELSSAVPSSVAIYDVGAASVGTTNAVQVGIDSAPHFTVGQNLVADLFTGYVNTAVNTSDFLIYLDDSSLGDLTVAAAGTTDVLQYETHFQGGDSGGPSFAYNSSTNSLEIIGIHSFVADFSTDGDDTTPERRGSADVFVSNYQTAINAKVAAVPEPSAFLLVLLLGLGRASRWYWTRVT